MKKTTVRIDFATEEAADHFLSWFCGSGEQAYWDWMQYREEEEGGNITAVRFDYHKPNGGEFGPKVATTLGRLDRQQ